MGAATITNEDLLSAVRQLTQATSDDFAQVNVQMAGLDERMERVEIRVDMLGVQLDRLEIRMDQLETRIDHMENQMGAVESRVTQIEQRLSEHGAQFAQIKTALHSIEGQHAAYVNDIENILVRIHVLETHMPDLTPQEFAELKEYLNDLSDWARRVAKVTKVPLKST